MCGVSLTSSREAQSRARKGTDDVRILDRGRRQEAAPRRAVSRVDLPSRHHHPPSLHSIAPVILRSDRLRMRTTLLPQRWPWRSAHPPQLGLAVSTLEHLRSPAKASSSVPSTGSRKCEGRRNGWRERLIGVRRDWHGQGGTDGGVCERAEHALRRVGASLSFPLSRTCCFS